MKNCKVYKDGSHYIAIRPTEGAGRDRRVLPPEECIIVDESSDVTDSISVAVQGETIQAEEGQKVMSELSPDEKPEKKFRISTRTDEFLRWYRESVGMKKSEQYRFIASKLAPYFTSQEDLYYFLDKKMYCRKRAETTRRIRCLRRAALHELNYFCTFTYNSKKLTESEFEKRLLTTLRHFASRKGWKYMGTWERGGDTDRLHFHGILYIPEGKMAGKLVQKREYDVKKKRMVEYTENTFFQDRFGRNTFDVIDGTALTLGTAVGYIVKYMEKTGGRMICSKGLRTFIETDIDNADIVAKLREEDDKKYVLFDDFKVYKDGKELGKVSPSVLEKAKTVN